MTLRTFALLILTAVLVGVGHAGAVEVPWQDKTALMFTMELREHAELISEAASGS